MVSTLDTPQVHDAKTAQLYELAERLADLLLPLSEYGPRLGWLRNPNGLVASLLDDEPAKVALNHFLDRGEHGGFIVADLEYLKRGRSTVVSHLIPLFLAPQQATLLATLIDDYPPIYGRGGTPFTAILEAGALLAAWGVLDPYYSVVTPALLSFESHRLNGACVDIDDVIDDITSALELLAE